MFTVLTGKLLLLFALTAAPFFVGGLCISLAMTRFSLVAHRLYFWDLLGAAGACLLVVPALGLLGGPIALLVSAALALGAALAFGRGSIGQPAVRRWIVSGGAVVALVAMLAPSLGWLRIRVAKGVDLGQAHAELNRWNSFSMVTVLPAVGFRGWGMSPAYRGPVPPQKTLVIDMNAMTTITQFDGRLETVRHALFDLSALVYSIRRDPGEVCVIGAGGGKDVLAALAGGATRVSAVEINPLIVDDVMRDRYADFSGHLYARDDVDVHVADGRSFVRGAPRRFDVILLSMVDTSAATAAGAYALTENSLYTADAFEDFIQHLSPGGVLSVSTVSLEGLAVGARLVSVAREALQRTGSDPSTALIVAETPWLSSPRSRSPGRWPAWSPVATSTWRRRSRR
jgi:hypothetical protein